MRARCKCDVLFLLQRLLVKQFVETYKSVGSCNFSFSSYTGKNTF